MITLIIICSIAISILSVAQSFSTAQAATNTFGNTSIGSNKIGTGGSSAKTGGLFYLGEAGTVTKITAYISGYGLVRAAIYSDSGGQPNALIGGTTQELHVPTSTGSWVDFVYSSPVSLSAGNYWLVLIYQNGLNWYFNYGGQSAWKFTTYGSEPTSSFSSHTDRTDAMSIYATYTTASVTYSAPTPPPSSSFNTPVKVAAAVYPRSILSDSDTTFIANNYDMISIMFDATGVQNIKNKNPSIKLLGYKDLIGANPKDSDWYIINSHEDWFIHDAYGNRIKNNLWGWYIMDVGNPGYRAYWVSTVNSKMGNTFSGVLADDVWNSLNGHDMYGFTDYTMSTWHNNVLGMLQYIKANITPGKLVIINTDEWHTYTYVSAVDGEMLEGFIHCDWEPVWTQGTRDPGLNLVIMRNLATNTAAGKIVWAVSGTQVSSDTAEMNRMVKYTYTGFLLSANGPNAYWAFNSWNSGDGLRGIYPIMDTTLGMPTGAYYQSQNVYVRDFTSGKVLWNPSGNYYTVYLGQTYTLLNGARVSSITLGPNSGEILLP